MDKTRQRFLIRWLQQQVRLARPWSSLTVLCGSLSAGLLIGQAWLLANLLYGFIQLGWQREQHLPMLALLAAMILGRAMLALLREQVAFKGAAQVRQAIRRTLLDTLTERGPAELQRRPAGSWASLLHEQVENLHDYYARYWPQTRLCLVQPLLILLVIFPVNWAAGLILLGTAPLIPIFMILTGIGAAEANRRNFAALRQLSGHFLDRLRGMATLRLYQRTEAEREHLANASEDLRSRTMEVLRMAFLSSAVLEFFASVSIALLAVYFGFSYLQHLNFGHYGQPVTLLTGLYVLVLAPDFYMPLRELGAHYHAKAQAIGAADEIEQCLNSQTLAPRWGDQMLPAQQALHIEAHQLEVLSLDGKVLLGPIDFQLSPGSLTLLVGHSGAGKSSLLQALLGFLPYRGELKINGQELHSLEPRHWRAELGWLGQNPKLRHGSLRDNLTLGRAIQDADLQRAAEQAGLAELIASKGWDYHLGDGMSGLSVGQAQRLALARTLLTPARLLLLDEPTASLDHANEQLIMASLSAARQGRTSLMISHRLDELARADQILVFASGRLLAAGTPAQLLDADGQLQSGLLQACTESGAQHA